MQRDLPGTWQKPVATVMPLAKGYEADKKASVHAARQALKAREQVSRRARERLDIAEVRHHQVLSGLDGEYDRDVRKFCARTQADEAGVEHLEAAALASVERAEAETREQAASEAGHIADRQRALDRVVRARSEAAETSKAVEAHVREAQDAADRSVLSSRESARQRLDELSRVREDAWSKRSSDVVTRETEKEGLLQNLESQSHVEVVRSEVARQRAAMAVDLAGARSQAMATEAGVRTSRDEALATDRVFQLSKAGHIMEGQLDCLLKDKLKDSALNLEAAHEYCQEVRRSMASENAQFQRRMRQIELEAAARARSEERKVNALEAERLNEFTLGHEALSQTENQLRSRRADCEAEAAELHQRLRQAEADSRQRADQILEQWIAGSEAAEQAVRQFEQQGRTIMESMQSDVTSKLKVFMEQNAAVQEEGTTKIVELERQANKVIDATQPALEAAKRDDEREAAEAVTKLREARHLPEEIRKKADEAIESKDANAREMEAELAQQAKLKIAAARAATKAAHEEQQWLQVETAEAWGRIRKACFELRLVNLHDFAQDIVSGDYDAQMLEMNGVAPA